MAVLYYCNECGVVAPDTKVIKHNDKQLCPACTSSNIESVTEYCDDMKLKYSSTARDIAAQMEKVGIVTGAIQNHVALENMIDTGERVEHSTGALREPHNGKGRFDLIPPELMFRIAKWYELGAIKYGDRNWEKGIPISNCMNSLLRHAYKYIDGWDDEDHLAAIVWNAAAIMYYENNVSGMQDLPKRKRYQDA